MDFLKAYGNKDGLVVFLHGLESSTKGQKAEFLKSNFQNTYIPELGYRDEPPQDLFNRIESELSGKNIKLIIGSSLGGYLAYSICKKLNCPGLLFNPALSYNSVGLQFDESGQNYPKLTVVLGKLDDIVEPETVIDYLNNNYDNSKLNINFEDMGHRVPADIFEKWVRLIADSDIIKKFEKFVAKDLNIKKGNWTQLDIPEDEEKKDQYENEFFNLIDTAYKEIGGYAKIKYPDDVFADKDWNFWKVIDIDEDPDVDVIMWGETTPFGIKSCGVGHDGSDNSKKHYLTTRANDFNDKSKNYYGEVSGKLAAILINKYQVPVVEDEKKIRTILGPNKEIEFYGSHPDIASGKTTERDSPGKGWYKRMIGGKPYFKIMVGNPKV